jgi:UPF0271 protein
VGIDLNADVGEGFAADDELLPLLTSASIACGFHAGDAVAMRRTCAAAAAAAVRIGAHPSYLDRGGFGRRELGLEPPHVADEVAYQIGALVGCARLEGAQVAYVKPHGALYERCRNDEAMAGAVAGVAHAFDAGLKLMCPPGSALAVAAAARGLGVVAEGFADRRYTADGSLVPRASPGAILTLEEAVAQAVSLAAAERFDSLCIHSDTPGAVEIARAIRAALAAAGVDVRAAA